VAGSVEDLLLGGSFVEDLVEVELVYFAVFVVEGDSAIDGLEGLLGELVAHRSDPDVDIDLVVLVRLPVV